MRKQQELLLRRYVKTENKCVAQACEAEGCGERSVIGGDEKMPLQQLQQKTFHDPPSISSAQVQNKNP